MNEWEGRAGDRPARHQFNEAPAKGEKMGSGSFDPAKYETYRKTTDGKSTADIYAASALHADLNPRGVVRESRDSADNPQSTPVIVALDVTGSMGMLADVIARKGLGVLFNELLAQKPITDPHLMFMAVGDANYDKAPLQVSQFEADNRIVEQLTQIYLEHGGGGNSFESYNLPWFFAAHRTVHDSFEKRAKRGYLFTVGDEEAPKALTIDQVKAVCGDVLQAEASPEEMLNEARRTYDVFHIMIGEGNHARSHEKAVRDSWTRMLGQRAIWLADHTKLAETIIAAIEVAEGASAEAVGVRLGVVVGAAVKEIAPSRRLLGA